MANYKETEERLIIPRSAIVTDGDVTHVRDFKGVWISRDLWLDENITPTEMKLLAEIDSLSKGKQGCLASNKYLGKMIRVSAGRCANIISSLRKRGYIETIKMDGRKRWLRVNVKADLTETVNRDLTETVNRDLTETVNIDNRIDNSKEKDSVPNGTSISFSENTKNEPTCNGKRVDVMKVFDRLNEILHPTKKCRPVSGYLNKLRTRLKTFTPNEIVEAAEKLVNDDFMSGKNGNRKKYATIKYLIRNDENVDYWLNQEIKKRWDEA